MARRSVGEQQAEANLVLERKCPVGQNVSDDDLAVVYGDKLGSYERSVKSTRQRKLHLLRLLMYSLMSVQELIKDFAFPHHLNNDNVASFSLDRSTIKGCSKTKLSAKEASSATSTYEEIHGGERTASSMTEIVMHEETRAVPKSSAMSWTTTIRSLNDELARAELKRMETKRQVRLAEERLRKLMEVTVSNLSSSFQQ